MSFAKIKLKRKIVLSSLILFSLFSCKQQSNFEDNSRSNGPRGERGKSLKPKQVIELFLKQEIPIEALSEIDLPSRSLQAKFKQSNFKEFAREINNEESLDLTDRFAQLDSKKLKAISTSEIIRMALDDHSDRFQEFYESIEIQVCTGPLEVTLWTSVNDDKNWRLNQKRSVDEKCQSGSLSLTSDSAENALERIGSNFESLIETKIITYTYQEYIQKLDASLKTNANAPVKSREANALLLASLIEHEPHFQNAKFSFKKEVDVQKSLISRFVVALNKKKNMSVRCQFEGDIAMQGECALKHVGGKEVACTANQPMLKSDSNEFVGSYCDISLLDNYSDDLSPEIEANNTLEEIVFSPNELFSEKLCGGDFLNLNHDHFNQSVAYQIDGTETNLVFALPSEEMVSMAIPCASGKKKNIDCLVKGNLALNSECIHSVSGKSCLFEAIASSEQFKCRLELEEADLAPAGGGDISIHCKDEAGNLLSQHVSSIDMTSSSFETPLTECQLNSNGTQNMDNSVDQTSSDSGSNNTYNSHNSGSNNTYNSHNSGSNNTYNSYSSRNATSYKSVCSSIHNLYNSYGSYA